jgi:hypothetical protein
VSRGQRNDDNLTAALANFARANDSRLSIVSPLHQNVRTECVDQLARRVLVEDDDRVHSLQRRKHVAALRRASNWSLGSFESPHRFIAVHTDHECFAATSRAKQDVDVAGVEEIENTVREHDSSANGRAPD